MSDTLEFAEFMDNNEVILRVEDTGHTSILIHDCCPVVYRNVSCASLLVPLTCSLLCDILSEPYSSPPCSSLLNRFVVL